MTFTEYPVSERTPPFPGDRRGCGNLAAMPASARGAPGRFHTTSRAWTSAGGA